MIPFHHTLIKTKVVTTDSESAFILFENIDL
jgi:hypothetical protein